MNTFEETCNLIANTIQARLGDGWKITPNVDLWDCQFVCEHGDFSMLSPCYDVDSDANRFIKIVPDFIVSTMLIRQELRNKSLDDSPSCRNCVHSCYARHDCKATGFGNLCSEYSRIYAL